MGLAIETSLLPSIRGKAKLHCIRPIRLAGVRPERCANDHAGRGSSDDRPEPPSLIGRNSCPASLQRLSTLGGSYWGFRVRYGSIHRGRRCYRCPRRRRRHFWSVELALAVLAPGGKPESSCLDTAWASPESALSSRSWQVRLHPESRLRWKYAMAFALRPCR